MSGKLVEKNTPAPPQLIAEIKALIEEGRTQVAQTVNSTLTMLYWQIGRKINDEVLKGVMSPIS